MSAIRLTYKDKGHTISVYEDGNKICCQCFQTEPEEFKKLCEWIYGKFIPHVMSQK